jgi:DNA polymerase III subunit alpha
MAKFAEYGFNKSHSAAYGLLTYQTAYLKAHYSAEFMASLMTTEMDNTDKITKYIGDARVRGLEVLSPDVNRSQKRFSVEKIRDEKKGIRRAIRFGLEGIKGVGGIAVDAILESRANGEFANALDFCRRVPTRKVNKKVLESLTLAGAFDSIAEVNRPSLFASLETLLEHAGDEQEERELGQSSLFDSFGSDEIKMVTPTNSIFKQEADWPTSRKLALEKQVVGFYVSGHPLDTWQRICEDWLGWSTEKIKNHAAEKAAQRKTAPVAQSQEMGFGPGRFRAPKTEVRLAGLITEMREVMTKKGSRMAFGQIEDLKGKLEVVFFPEAYAKLQEFLKGAAGEAEPVLLTGDVELGDEAPKILVKELGWVKEAHEKRVQSMTLKLNPAEISPDQLRELKKSLLQFRGKCPVRIEFTDPSFRARMELPGAIGVSVTPALVKEINRIFGSDVVRIS